MFEIGQKIAYRTEDSEGNEKWYQGTVHGVRSYEDPETKRVRAMSYLIDTGRNTRVDTYTSDQRDIEINKRLKNRIKKDADLMEVSAAVAIIQKEKDLPESKIEEHHVRQPEQIEVHPANLRALQQ